MDVKIKAFFAYFYFAAGNSLMNIWIANEKFKNTNIDIEKNFDGEEYFDIFYRGKQNVSKSEEKINFGKTTIQFRLGVLKKMGYDFSGIQELVDAIEGFDPQKFGIIATRYRNFLADDIEKSVKCPFDSSIIVDQYTNNKNILLLRIHLLIVLMLSDYHLETYIKKLNKLIQEKDELSTFKGPFIISDEIKEEKNNSKWDKIKKALEQFKDPLNNRNRDDEKKLDVKKEDWDEYNESINPFYGNKLIDKYIQVQSVINEGDDNSKEGSSIPKEVQIYDLLIEMLYEDGLLTIEEYNTLIKNNTKKLLKKHKGKLLFKSFQALQNGSEKTFRFVLGQELMFAIVLLNKDKDEEEKVTMNKVFEKYEQNLNKLEEKRKSNDTKQSPNRDNFYIKKSFSKEEPEELVAYEGNENYEGYNFIELYRKAVKNITRLGVALNNIKDEKEEKIIIDESKEQVTKAYINPSIEKLNDLMEYFQIRQEFLLKENNLTKDILVDFNTQIIKRIHSEKDYKFFRFKKRTLEPQKRENHSNLVTINASQLYRIFEESNADMNKVKYSDVFKKYSEINFEESHKFNKPYLNLSKSIMRYCKNKYDEIKINTEKYDIYGYISKSQYRIANKTVIDSINGNVFVEIKEEFNQSSPNQVNAYISVIELILEDKWHSIGDNNIKEYRNKIMHLDLFKYSDNELEGFDINKPELEELVNERLKHRNKQIEFYQKAKFGNLFIIKNNG
jgi:hypothetical protein